jgi:hypothetical protein
MFDTTPTAIAAPLVATVGLLAFLWALQQPRSRRWLGPAADGWEYARRGLLPLLDRFLDRQDGDHYASYHLGEQELVGLLDAPPEQVEVMLYRAGFRRMPLAALKRLPDGRTEIGSWAYRDGLLASEQVHVMLFRAEREGQTLVAAHREPNALNPATALAHYRGRGLDAEAGERAVRERLDEGVWVEG